MVKVGIVKSELPDVKGVLDLIDFSPDDYDLVAIKPNLCCPKPYYTGATTDLRLLEGVIKIFKEHAKELLVMESDGYSTTADESAEKSGVLDVCDYFEVPFFNLSKDIMIPVKGELKALMNVKIPRTFLKADHVINLPVMKTHNIAGVSLGMKNMFGIVPGKKNSHHSKLSDAIADVSKIKRPHLTIMDGIIGMEGDGPISGKPKKMDLTLASRDVLALDFTACRVMRINPFNIDHLQKAAYYGLGVSNPEKIEVVGERVEDVWDKFFS